MKYFIVPILLAITAPLFAQNNSSQVYVIKAGKTTVKPGNPVTTAINFESSIGGRGTMTKHDGATYITFCQNSGDSTALKMGNRMDTTNYRTSVSKKDNVITITHPNLQQSTITEDEDLIMIKAAGGTVAVFHKNSSATTNNASVSGGKYLISYNKNSAEVKTAVGTGFKFERKGNMAIVTSGEDEYSVMITTGKTSVIIDSNGVYSLVVNDDNNVAVMRSEGFQSYVFNEGATSRVVWTNGETQTVNNYGGLSLITSKDGGADAMFNYSKIETNNDTDGGEFTKVTVDAGK